MPAQPARCARVSSRGARILVTQALAAEGIARWHLFQGQLVSIVPIGLFAAAMLYLHWQVQENERERSQMESVRLITAAVDNALDSTVERLSIFARLWSSTDLSEEAIYGQAKEALSANADWRNIVAFGADGRGVFRTDIPFGDPVPASLHPELLQPVVVRRTPVISDVFHAAATGRPLVAVAVPVTHGGNVTHVLIASLDLTWYDRLLAQSGQPDGAVAGLLDRTLKFVARMDGYELARCIRDELGRGIVLIALTGYGSERDATRSADAGIDQHLTKPVDLNELMRVLDARQATQRGTEAVKT